jgi:NAD(P)H-dependent flavin oxidoreductase YrpB (nitropropane dioxygenase family)
MLELESKGAELKDLLPIISGLKNKLALENGDLREGICSCGQSVGLIHDLPSVRELIDRIIAEAEDALKRLNRIWIKGRL